MENSKYVIIVAAGSGIRLGSPLPKQFLEIGGKAIVHHTMEKFFAFDR
ncbi:MAG: 2-C-methyl-D-erythritol 4-phosphate cytidylyltransferase, partial [Bacteroidales bacterium]|nr:2-C-methyl-D-erythritol 4-phosphate cytidylyltransferase [Bacteroidales bacterium]